MITTMIDKFFENKKNISISLPSNHNTFLDNTNSAPPVPNMELTIFEKPLIGYADPHDPLFLEYKKRYEITYNQFILPQAWLPTAQTVVSIFLPFSDQIISSNEIHPKLPSHEWTYARYEGQQIINNFSKYLEEQLHKLGYDALAPSINKKFKATTDYETHILNNNEKFTSNWSERHVAFAAGLGTFGLSKGIITEKGMAGRFTSIITSLNHIPTKRKYHETYEYCNMCGECIVACPANAIALEYGKSHTICAKYVGEISKHYTPRFGCGKCQVNTPCSRQIPPKENIQ